MQPPRTTDPRPQQLSLAELDKALLWHPFTPHSAWSAPEHEPLLITSAQGCTLTDQHAHSYLDGNSSIWTCIHGHSHPTILAAIQTQMQHFAHSSFLGLSHPLAVQLAQELLQLLPQPLARVFYSDNGSTAVEAAVRMALQYFQQNGHPQRTRIISFDSAYHGDTLGAASLGGVPLFKGSAEQFGYSNLCLPHTQALEQIPSHDVAAVIIEPMIQGVARMRLWPPGTLQKLRNWCDRHGVLLIYDEVMTGFGRTGKMFALEHEPDALPDFLCLAKGITGGYLPLAATITTEQIFSGFLGPVEARRTFYYGHSYTGSALGCAAALGSLQVFREERTLEQLPGKIAHFTQALARLAAHPHVSTVRQCGLIAGIDVVKQKQPVVEYDWSEQVGARICLAARQQGLITRPILDTLVLMPPLCVQPHEIDLMVEALLQGIDAVCQGSAKSLSNLTK
jgi:adenosylmethionine---8-amino-7-oxononanoate aminotransferase